MTSVRDLVTEVREALADARKSGPVNARWLQQAIVNEHVRMGHVGSEWALCCVHEAIKGVIGRLLRVMKADEDDPEAATQLDLLSGWTRLQRDYLVQRDGERWILSLSDMTDAEIAQKAREHRKQGLGHYEHAEELERYLAHRMGEPPPFSWTPIIPPIAS